MKKTKLVEIKASFDDLNKFMIEQLQNFHGTKFKSVKIEGSIVIFNGEETNDASELGTNSLSTNVIAPMFNKTPTQEGDKRVVKNKGLSNWVREQLAGGVKINLTHFMTQAGLRGFELNHSYLRNHLRNIMKDEITEVNIDVFQLTEFYKQTHNQESLTHS